MEMLSKLEEEQMKPDQKRSVFGTPLIEGQSELVGLQLSNDPFSLGKKSRKQSVNFSELVEHQCKQQKHFVVGISGGICAGKFNLVQQFKEKLGKNICYLSIENFYKSENLMNYDLPESINWEKMHSQLDDLLNDKSIDVQVYDIMQDKNTRTKRVHSTQVIIIEGTFIFYDEVLRNKMDLRLYLDTDEDLRLSRKVYRDVCVKGSDYKAVIDKYMRQVKPAFEKYVLPYKKYADIIIPNYGGEFKITKDDEKSQSNLSLDTLDIQGFQTMQHPVIDIISDKIASNTAE